jgi:hypothetical protein
VALAKSDDEYQKFMVVGLSDDFMNETSFDLDEVKFTIYYTVGMPELPYDLRMAFLQCGQFWLTNRGSELLGSATNRSDDKADVTKNIYKNYKHWLAMM